MLQDDTFLISNKAIFYASPPLPNFRPIAFRHFPSVSEAARTSSKTLAKVERRGRKAAPRSLTVSFPAIRKLPFLYVHLAPTLLFLLPFYFTPIAVNPARSLGGILKAALLSAALCFSCALPPLRSYPQVYFSFYRSMHVIIFISHKKTALRRRQYSLLSCTCVRAYGNNNRVYVSQLRVITADSKK